MGHDGRQEKALCDICGGSQLAYDLKSIQGKATCPLCRSRHQKEGQVTSSGRFRRTTADSWSNPRRSERVDVDEAYVRLARPGAVFGIFGGSSHLGKALDLSLTGAQCMTELNIKKGDVVQVELRLPGVSEVLDTKGMIRWVAPAGGGRHRVGIEFVDTEFYVRKLLEIYVHEQSSKVFRKNEETAEHEALQLEDERIPLPEHLRGKVRAHREQADDEVHLDARGIEAAKPIVSQAEPPPAATAEVSDTDSALPPATPLPPPPPPPAPPLGAPATPPPVQEEATPRTRRGSNTRHIGRRDTREDFDFGDD